MNEKQAVRPKKRGFEFESGHLKRLEQLAVALDHDIAAIRQRVLRGPKVSNADMAMLAKHLMTTRLLLCAAISIYDELIRVLEPEHGAKEQG
jgi:hypothetical protein